MKKYWYITLRCAPCGKDSGADIWGEEDEIKFIGCSGCGVGFRIALHPGAHKYIPTMHIDVAYHPSGI